MQKPVEEPATYATSVAFGNEYRVENRSLENDIRECLKETKGQLVEAYGPVPDWDLLIIADFPTGQDAIEFRAALKVLGMWKVESTPTVSIATLTRIAKTSRVHATSHK